VRPRRVAGVPQAVEGAATQDLLRRVAALAPPLRSEESRELFAKAVRRAGNLARALEIDRATIPVAGVVLVADLAAAVAVESCDDRQSVRAFVDEAGAVLGVEPRFLRRAVIVAAGVSSALVELPPRLGAEVQLRLVVALAPVAAASLWLNRAGSIECLLHVGAGAPTRRARAAAVEAVAGTDRPSGALVIGVPVVHWGERTAALVIRARAGRREESLALAEELATALIAFVEKDRLLERNEDRERSLIEATERRLVRLGFDLHDRPLQDLAALVAETRLLREQLAQAPSLDQHRRLVIGRFDDFEERVLAIESDVRALVQSLESGALVHVPFFELIGREVMAYEGTSLDVSFEGRGRADGLTQSQRIALLRVIEEALANVRDHSGAARARVTVSIGRAYLRAEVTDDGRGFDVEQTFADAAQSGRLGLVGMVERIRLLGGRLDVRSEPGGPTTIRVSLPRWRPPDAGAPDAP
jgi:signal transduction histidine kinase